MKRDLPGYFLFEPEFAVNVCDECVESPAAAVIGRIRSSSERASWLPNLWREARFPFIQAELAGLGIVYRTALTASMYHLIMELALEFATRAPPRGK